MDADLQRINGELQHLLELYEQDPNQPKLLLLASLANCLSARAVALAADYRAVHPGMSGTLWGAFNLPHPVPSDQKD
jgi:hypothetical protein